MPERPPWQGKCCCLGTARYLFPFCPHRASHKDWSQYPPFWDGLMQGAAEYHDEVMARTRKDAES